MALLRYTAARAALLVAALALLYLLGLRSWLLVIAGLLLSGLASLVLLRRSRDAVSIALIQRRERIQAARSEPEATPDDPGTADSP